VSGLKTFLRVGFVAGILLSGLVGNVFALTASGVSISNSASIAYTVSGVAQTPVTSSSATFVVDNKVDITVTTGDAGSSVDVTPGSSAQVLTYTVTNSGNTIQDFSLSATKAAGFDPENVHVFVETAGGAGYQPGSDTATYIDELAAGASKVVYIVSDIPAAQVDGDESSYDLIAQVAAGGTGGSKGADIISDNSGIADNPATVQIVFADGAGTGDGAKDGKFSSRDKYKCKSAHLTVTKSSLVISDPFNNGTNPKAIPGATVKYTITVLNGGTVAATSVTLVDQPPANTTYVPASITLNPDGSGAVAQTDANDPATDKSDWNITNAGKVTVLIPTLAIGATATITFNITIN
jgi:uncharacterized repeat protein (TIGR01451 family)